jgi:ABC-2 type transport system ATP-binding protein
VLGQVEPVCDRVGILHEGRLVAEGAIDDLRGESGVGPDATVEDLFVSVTDGPATVDETEGVDR